MKIFRNLLVILLAILLTRVLVVSLGGTIIAIHSILDLPEGEKNLAILYWGMAIYGLACLCILISMGYLLYRIFYKAHKSSPLGLALMFGVTIATLVTQMFFSSLHDGRLQALDEFAESTLWIPGALVLANVLLLIANLSNNYGKGLKVPGPET